MLRVAFSIVSCLAVADVLAAPSTTIKICFDDWPPYAGYTAKTGFQGTTIELLRENLAKLGAKVQFKSATQTRCLAEARQGLVDMVLFSRRENLPGWKLTQVPTEFWLVGAWVPADASPRRFETIDQFRSARVGMVRDYVYPPLIATFKDWRVNEVGDAIDALRQLAARRIDVVFEDVFWTQRMVVEHKLRIRMLEPLVVAEAEAHIYHPRYTVLFTQFEGLLNEAIRRGEVDRRYREVLGISYDAVRKGHYHQAFAPKEAEAE